MSTAVVYALAYFVGVVTGAGVIIALALWTRNERGNA